MLSVHPFLLFAGVIALYCTCPLLSPRRDTLESSTVRSTVGSSLPLACRNDSIKELHSSATSIRARPPAKSLHSITAQRQWPPWLACASPLPALLLLRSTRCSRLSHIHSPLSSLRNCPPSLCHKRAASVSPCVSLLRQVDLPPPQFPAVCRST